MTQATVMDPNYSLPLNVALITLQVIQLPPSLYMYVHICLSHFWSVSVPLPLTFRFTGIG